VSHELLATPEDLTTLLEAHDEEEESHAKVMQGWRREAIGTQLLDAKRSRRGSTVA
jgi:ribonuclease D